MDDRSVFVVYFAGLMAMRFHPGNAKDENVCPTIDQCIKLACAMVDITNEEYPICHG